MYDAVSTFGLKAFTEQISLPPPCSYLREFAMLLTQVGVGRFGNPEVNSSIALLS